MFTHILGQRAQGAEDPAIIFIVGAKLQPVTLGYFQRKFQRIYGIEAETGPEQRGLGIDRICRNSLEVQGIDDELGDFFFGFRLRRRHGSKYNRRGRLPSAKVS